MRGVSTEESLGFIEFGKNSAHEANRITAFGRKAAVSGVAVTDDLVPCITFVSNNQLEISRLKYDSRIGLVFSEEILRASAVAFLINHRSEKKRTRKLFSLFDECNCCGTHRSHSRFYVQRAAPEESAIALTRRKRVNHIARANSVYMRENR